MQVCECVSVRARDCSLGHPGWMRGEVGGAWRGSITELVFEGFGNNSQSLRRVGRLLEGQTHSSRLEQRSLGSHSISCSVAKWEVPPLSDPGPACFILYKAFSPDGSCWEVRAPSKVVSSSSSNPLYQRDEA